MKREARWKHKYWDTSAGITSSQGRTCKDEAVFPSQACLQGSLKPEAAEGNASGGYLERKKDRCRKSQKIWTISRFVRVILAQGPC
jgi:hypothetical protein